MPIDGQDPQPVVVLGYKFWQRHYGGDPSVIGKTIQLMRKNYTIVGVAGSRFTWGDGDVYLPLKVTGDQVKGLLCGRSAKARSHARPGQRCAGAADQAIRKGDAETFPAQLSCISMLSD